MHVSRSDHPGRRWRAGTGRALAAVALVACIASVTGPAEGLTSTAAVSPPASTTTPPVGTAAVSPPASTTTPPVRTTTTTTTSVVSWLRQGASVIDEGFEDGPSAHAGWTADAGLTLSVDAAAARTGSAGLRVAGTVGTGDGVRFTLTSERPLPVGAYVFGAWVRLPQGQPPVLLNLSGMGGHSLLVTDTGWTRLYSYTRLNTPASVLSVSVVATSYCDGPLPTAFLLDDVQATFSGDVMFTWYPNPVHTCDGGAATTPSPSTTTPSRTVGTPTTSPRPTVIRPTVTRPTLTRPTVPPSTMSQPAPTRPTVPLPTVTRPVRTLPTVPPV